jgi:hypothetical protein
MYTARLSWIQSGVALLLTMALSACSSSIPANTPSPTGVPPTATRAIPTVTLPAIASATVTSKPTQGPPLIPGPDISFQDVTFNVPTGVGTAVQAQVAPETERLGEFYPAYTEFTLIDYNSLNTRTQPQIKIYPIHELSPAVTQIVQELKDLLANRPTTLPRGIPILPVIPAGQLIDVQIEYLTFNNGSGLRVLTQLGQGSWPINNEGLVYIFQGLTSDDAYYISAFLPVSAPFLPDHIADPATVPTVDGISYPEFNSPNFNPEYARYRGAIIHKLNTTSVEEFVPALSALDSMIESLQLASVTAQRAESVPCVNGLPTRLRIGTFAYVNPDPPVPNNLRREAGKSNSLIGDIQPGAAMKILEGPKCADGWVWWKVRTLETELVGWTPEGDQKNYWLIPCESRSQCGS